MEAILLAWQEYFTPKRTAIYLTLLFIFVLVIIFYKSIATALMPFIAGLILAALLEPVIVFLHSSIRIPRGIAIMITIVIMVTLVSYVLFAFIAKMVAELVDFVSRFGEYEETITSIINDVFLQFEVFNEKLPDTIRNTIDSSLETFFNTLNTWVKNLLDHVTNLFYELPVFLLVTIIAIVATYFFSKDKDLIINTFMHLVPDRFKPQIDKATKKIAVDMMGFVKGRLILLLISTSIATAGLIMLNNRYWLILGILIGILDIIPTIGPGIIFTPWIIFTFVLGDPHRAILLLVIYSAIFAIRQFLEPKIIGDSVGIHPLVMLATIYGGYVFFGVLGIFIGPILAIMIKAIINVETISPTNIDE